MATFVTSDAHGHLRALDRALELAAPGADDIVYVLGDMIDRGPEPVGVLRFVRGMANARVLMGNHERMMLDALFEPNPTNTLTWEMNRGTVTSDGLDALPREEADGLIDWVASLPLFDVVAVRDERPAAGADARGLRAPEERPERVYVLTHAGIDARRARAYLREHGAAEGEAGGYANVDLQLLRGMMEAQDPEDLLWIREEFWGAPTGLVGADGRGPVVLTGHTPSFYLDRFGATTCGDPRADQGMGRIFEVGACFDTGGEADRIDIDCAAAAGYPLGRVGVMRLEDRKIWYAEIEDGE